MKWLIPLTLCCLTLASLGQQADTKVTTATVAYNQGDYQKALDDLNTALENPSTLKEKSRVKAYYYRAKTKVALVNKYSTEKNLEALEGAQNYMLEAHYDLRKATKEDKDGKYKAKIELEENLIQPYLMQIGLSILNQSYQVASADEKKVLYSQVLKHLDAALEINDKSYMAYDLRGQTHLGLQDSAKAYQDFTRALKEFQASPPARPDLLIAYISYRLALLDRYKNNDLDKALAALEKGEQLLEQELTRVFEDKGSFTESDLVAYEKQHADATSDLSNFELDIYLNYPEKMKEALAKFEKAIEKDPGNYIIHIAYGQLLEKTSVEKAEMIYQKAIEIDPGTFIGHFNLGVLYVNEGVKHYKLANEAEAEEDYQKEKGIGDSFFNRSLKYLEDAYQINAYDMQLINALMQVTITLDRAEQYKMYKERKKELGG